MIVEDPNALPLERLHHEVTAAIMAIPGAEGVTITDSRIEQHMPEAYELMGITRKVRLWPTVPGHLPFQPDVDVLLKGICNAIKSIKATPSQAHPAPANTDKASRYNRFRFQDYTFTIASRVLVYAQTGESGGGEGELFISIGVIETLLD